MLSCCYHTWNAWECRSALGRLIMTWLTSSRGICLEDMNPVMKWTVLLYSEYYGCSHHNLYHVTCSSTGGGAAGMWPLPGAGRFYIFKVHMRHPPRVNLYDQRHYVSPELGAVGVVYIWPIRSLPR